MCLGKIVITAGGLVETTKRLLSVLSERCRVMWYGLMKRRITCFISTRVHLRNHRMRICALLSGDTTRGSAHVPHSWPYPLRSRKSR